MGRGEKRMRTLIASLLFFAALYLWAVENAPYVCGVLWIVAPFILLFLYGRYENREG